MMTSAPTYGGAGFPTAALSDGCSAGDDGSSLGTGTGTGPGPGPGPGTGTSSSAAVATGASAVKRPLGGHPLASDPCKKRRKQSTPIRISTGGAADDVNGSLGEGKLGPFLASSPDHSPEGTPTPAPAPATQLCLSQFATDEHLLSHVKIEDAAVPADDVAAATADSPVNLSGGQNFPPWMSDVHPKSDDWLGAATAFGPAPAAAASAPASTVYLGAGVSHYAHADLALSTQGRAAAQPPIRIFNPDAYCELCNKEFCNKYFLKTHKANKHRIYSEPAASSAPQPLPLSDTPPALTVNVPSFSAPTFKRTILTPGPAPPPDAPPPKPTDQHKPPVALPPVYCDICGKSFCNKKMLRTHRAITHGFLPEYEQCADSGDSERAHPPLDDEPEPEPEHPDANTSEDDNAPSKEGLVPMRNGHTIKEENVCEPDDASSSAHPLQAATLSQSHQLPQSQLQQRDANDFTTSRLRRLGIMNPEAFCEICCKEYCNKYFLRTHKMKRHGILIPDDNSKDNQKDFKLELSISNSWYQIQTSPLNLIMGEQSTNSSGSCGERKASPANENECEICGMRFQTAYLAQLHAAAAHSRPVPAPAVAPAPGVGPGPGPMPPLKPDTDTGGTTVATAATDTISEDLQKLQTMILQLNDLDVSRVGGNVCHFCNREFENKYHMHAHMMTEHGTLLEEGAEPDRHNESDTASAGAGGAAAPLGDLFSCKTCGRDGFTADTLKQHTAECRGVAVPAPPATPNLSGASLLAAADAKDDSNGFANSDKSTNRNQVSVGGERRASVTLTPTSSYCEICNKELCNKYFMKTHMQRMHGIEIENGAQIGGVVCNICNKELCSKYFLRVHKHNTHGIVEEGSGAGAGTAAGSNSVAVGVGAAAAVATLPQRTQPDQDAAQAVSEQPAASDAALKPADLSDLSHRYFTHFTEVCSICGRRFRSTKWLKAHLLGDHGKAGADKWAELEAQLQQSFGQHTRKGGPASDRSTSPATLRIPNGGSGGGTVIVNATTASAAQETVTNVKHGVQTVLSSFFGTDESNVKQYHCSFCSFSTPILAFLFVHERSHARPPSGSEADAVPLQCAVCNQSFRQPDQLHHHVLSQHPFLSLGPFFSGVPQPAQFTANETRTDIKQETPEVNEQNQQVQVSQQHAPQAQEHKCAKCTQCGRSRRQSRATGRHLELSADVSSTLKDVSKQSQLPTTYALPQRPQQQIKYVMQAFLMDEPTPVAALPAGGGTASGTASPASSSDVAPHHHSQQAQTAQQQQQPPPTQQQQVQQRGSNGAGGGGSPSDRRFAPSIVFLPVLERLTGPLTVSFTLTPA